MPEEIRVIADLDTSLFEAGVRRTNTAIPKIREKIEDATKIPPSIGEDAGEKIGNSFSKGFIRKLVIRDAIYSVISGIGEALKSAEASLNKLTGADVNLSIWKSLGDIITGIAESTKTISNLVISKAQGNISEITADERARLDLERYKHNPQLLKESSADLEADIERATAKQAADKINNQQLHINKAKAMAASQAAMSPGAGDDAPGFKFNRYANAGPDNSDPAHRPIGYGLSPLELAAKPDSFFATEGANITDSELPLENARDDKKIANAKALLEISKERDKLDKKDLTAHNKEAQLDANLAMAGYIGSDKAKKIADKKAAADAKKAAAAQKRADAKTLADRKRADALAARIKKNHEEHADAAKITEDEASARRGGKELSFDREQLEHQRATSAVRINGGLFGKNDSAATLVQHAATQISLLRSIDNELKQTRQDKSDLTLL